MKTESLGSAIYEVLTVARSMQTVSQEERLFIRRKILLQMAKPGTFTDIRSGKTFQLEYDLSLTEDIGAFIPVFLKVLSIPA